MTLKSIAPAKIYEEGDLIKRSIRDLYNRDIDEVFVEGERGYRIAKDFMKMIMPSHAKNVKRYEDQMPLFARYQVESYLSGMFNPTVQLPSGGYIVIGVTEALVAVDVNSGRATKEGSIEQTALKTNLEAADEVARQVRLRDLAGLIVIDFIDMDERKNNASVEKRMKDKLKTDRARIQIGRISGFGLMEMSRQRLRPGMIEATTQPCQACHGTGLIRSDDNLALAILRSIEEEGTRNRSREVLIKAPVGIANFLMNQKREHIANIEIRYGLSVRVEGDPHLVSPDFSLEKFKTATRVVAPVAAHVVSVDTSLMDQIDEAEAAQADEDEAAAQARAASSDTDGEDTDDKPKRKRRRRRRSRGGKSNGSEEYTGNENDSDESSEDAKSDQSAVKDTETDAEPVAETEKPKPKSRSRSRSRSSKPKEEATEANSEDAVVSTDVSEEPVEAPAEPAEKPKRKRAPRKPKVKVEKAPEETPVAMEAQDAPVAPPEADAPAAPEKSAEVSEEAASDGAPVPEAPQKPDDTPAAETPDTPRQEEPSLAEPVAVPTAASAPPETSEPQAEPDTAKSEKPRRKGWWSLGSR